MIEQGDPLYAVAAAIAVLTVADYLGGICAVMVIGGRTMATYMPHTGAVWYFGPTGDEW